MVKANKGVFPNVGQRVMWHANIGEQGALSEYTKVPNFAVSVVPSGLNPAIAATLPCAGMAALISLDKIGISEGDTIFIEGGAGAVGQFAIQYAKQRGADVFTTASKRNHKLVKRERLANYTYVLKFQGNKLSISGSGWHSSSRQAQM